VAAKGRWNKEWTVFKMTKRINQGKYMSQTAYRAGARRSRAGIVALALAGVLAIGGAGVVCVTGFSKSPGQAPVAAQVVATQQAAATPAKAAPQQAAATSAAPVAQAENTDNGSEAKLSREECIAKACAFLGAGGQAKGDAQNVSASGPITGGGTVYYVVELDLGEVHYRVNVDAVDGGTYGAESMHHDMRTPISNDGTYEVSASEPVDA